MQEISEISCEALNAAETSVDIGGKIEARLAKLDVCWTRWTDLKDFCMRTSGVTFLRIEDICCDVDGLGFRDSRLPDTICPLKP